MEGEMKEIRQAAMAYFANLTEHQKGQAWDFFMGMDSDGDGRVSLQEYLDYIHQNHHKRNCFHLIDQNGDGFLDFEECAILFYMINSGRLVTCDGLACNGRFLGGLYFTCVTCYEAGGNTFDLCCSCFHHKKFSHGHTHFLDNFALLRQKQPGRSLSLIPCQSFSSPTIAELPTTATASTSNAVVVYKNPQTFQPWKFGYQIIQTAAINAFANACNIL